LAALVIVWIPGIPYNVVIRITHLRQLAGLAAMVAVMFALGYLLALSVRIHRESAIDDARPADAIVVMGAAEYGGAPAFTEGGVGRSYLVAHGVPAESVIVENAGDSTVKSLAAVYEIFKRMGLRSCIVVSDGYHVFRVKRILAKQGITAWGSPREDTGGPALRAWWLCFRQAVGYALWRVGVPV